jgi:DNA-binding MarR family transcriptional regulator
MKKLKGPDLCHCLAARRYARLLTRLYDHHLSPTNISCSQFSILALINEQPDISISELADAMVMERTTLVRALKPLQSKGFILSYVTGPRDALRLSLSKEGLAKFLEADDYWQVAQAEIEDLENSDEAASLRNAILKRIAKR